MHFRYGANKTGPKSLCDQPRPPPKPSWTNTKLPGIIAAEDGAKISTETPEGVHGRTILDSSISKIKSLRLPSVDFLNFITYEDKEGTVTSVGAHLHPNHHAEIAQDNEHTEDDHPSN